MAEQTCTYYPEFKYEDSCSTLGRPVFTTLNNVEVAVLPSQTQLSYTSTGYTYAHVPGISFLTTNSNDGSFVVREVPTSTNCLVGGADCNSLFSASRCPFGFFPAAWGERGGMTLATCCPTVPFATAAIERATFQLVRESFWLETTTDGQTSSALVGRQLCKYGWYGPGQNYALPTVIPRQTIGDQPTSQDGHVFLYAPVWATHKSFILSSPTSTQKSVSGTLQETLDPKTSNANQRQSLSPTARAGIGVGASIGGLLLLFAIFGALYYLRRRKQHYKSNVTGEGFTEKPELDGNGLKQYIPLGELGVGEVYELSDTGQPIEICSRGFSAPAVGEHDSSPPANATASPSKKIAL